MVSRFPPLAEVRSVAERMKALDPDRVIIASNRSGQVKLVMSNDNINIETIWNDLSPGDDHLMAPPKAEPSKRFKSVRVDLKSFVRLLSCQLPEHKTELWILQRQCASFVVSLAEDAKLVPSLTSHHRFPSSTPPAS
jgi:HUS1 checkpoint protein